MNKNGTVHWGPRVHSQGDSVGADPCFTKYTLQWGKESAHI